MKKILFLLAFVMPILGISQDVFQVYEAGTSNLLDKDHIIDLGFVTPGSTELIEFDIGVSSSCFGGTVQGTITEISSELGLENVFSSLQISFTVLPSGLLSFSQNITIPANPQAPGRAFVKIAGPNIPGTFVQIVYYSAPIGSCVVPGYHWDNEFSTCNGRLSCPPWAGFCQADFNVEKASFCAGNSPTSCHWTLNLFHTDGVYELANHSGSSALSINGPLKLPYRDWLINDDGFILGRIEAANCRDFLGNFLIGAPESLVYVKINDGDCEGDCGEMTITENTVWDNPRILPVDLKIKSGNTLTIRNTVHIAEQKKIMVEPGARLIVNGGHLTNNCDDTYWFGIEVWGDRNKWQSIQNQGFVSLSNAKIEKAQNALTTKRQNCPSGWDWNSTGGIIKAVNSEFINNRRSAEFLSFQNKLPHSGNEVDNQGTFLRCDFLLDDDYSYPGGKSAQITMWNVRGIKVTGCTFKDNRALLTTPAEAGIGIEAIGASFRVNPGCSAIVPFGHPCPVGDVIPSVFENLEYGIQASELEVTAPKIKVNKSQFINNKVGIEFDFIHNQSEVVQNTFEIWHPKSDCIRDTDFGLILENSRNFLVQENSFSENNSTQCTYPYPRTVGIWTKDAGELPNEVYKNSFDGLDIGNWARGENKSNLLPGLYGLEYLCNANSNNEVDFFIDGTSPTHGIRLEQGNKNLAAGNTFSNSPSNIWHIFKSPTLTSGMNYYYELSPNQNPTKVNFGINRSLATPNTCKSKIIVASPSPDPAYELVKINDCCYNLQLEKQSASKIASFRFAANDDTFFGDYSILDDGWELITANSKELAITSNGLPSNKEEGYSYPVQICLENPENDLQSWTSELVALTGESYFEVLATHCSSEEEERATNRNREVVEKVKEQFDGKIIKLSPNPTADQVFVEVSKEFSENGWLEVFDITGKKVLDDIIYPNEIKSINLVDFPSGMYVVKILIAEQVFTETVIKR